MKNTVHPFALFIQIGTIVCGILILCLYSCASLNLDSNNLDENAQDKQNSNTTVMQWHKLELSFTGPLLAESSIKNPFTDYQLDVLFIGPSGQQYSVPGFYAADGNASETGATEGSQWQVRFSPDEVGQWQYLVTFNMAENIVTSEKQGKSAGYFDNEKGVFTVTPSSKQADGKDFRGKGKLEYVNQPFLQFKGNKEYFLKAGANSPEVFLGFKDFDNTPSPRDYVTHVKDWQTGDPVWHSNKGKGLIGMINYLASLDNNVFYFLTMNIEGDGKQVFPWITEIDTLRYDVSKLAQWNIVFEHMQSNGIMTHFVLTETENESLFEWRDNKVHGGFANSRKIYYREMFARFGYLLATTWNIGEENGWVDPTGDDENQKANTTQQRKEFADYFQKLSYYNEHIVIHNGPSEDYHIFDKEADNIIGYKSYTGPSLQGDYLSKNVYLDVLKYRKLADDSNKTWVVSMDEAYITPVASNIDLWRKENVWATFMAGGAGIEFYLGGGEDLTAQNLRNYQDYYQTMANTAKFFKDYVPFWSLTSDENYLDNAWTLKNEGQFYLFYFKEGGSNSVTLPAGNYSVKWFNPIDNILQDGNIINIKGELKQSLGIPTKSLNSHDWACIVERIKE